MPADPSELLGLCVAVGVGLLIGAERERRKGSGATRGAAGIRTFSATALLGAVSVLMGGGVVLAAALLLVGVLGAIAYQRKRDKDPGITTEIALLVTCLLGGLAVRQAILAAAVGTALTALLAVRNRLHYFVSGVLTEPELHDLILFSAVALIVLPLAPDRFMGPFDAINPRAVARLITLVMAIGALGHIALRSLGPRYGLPLAGFAAGFISSTATIHSMGELAAKQPSQITGAVAGAVLSSVATIIQLAIVVTLVQPALLRALVVPLAASGLAACAYGIVPIFRSVRAPDERRMENLGHAVDLKTALAFAAIVSFVLLLSAGLNAWLGSRGMLLGAALTGLVDPHATAAAVASLVAAGKVPPADALQAILAGLTTNSAMKALVAFNSGGARYAVRIVPGLAFMTGALWLGAWGG